MHKDNAIVEDPTLLDWQSVIDKTADKKEFVVKNDLTKAVSVEQDIYSKEILGKVGEPEKEDATEDTNNGVDIEVMEQDIVQRLTHYHLLRRRK